MSINSNFIPSLLAAQIPLGHLNTIRITATRLEEIRDRRKNNTFLCPNELDDANVRLDLIKHFERRLYFTFEDVDVQAALNSSFICKGEGNSVGFDVSSNKLINWSSDFVDNNTTCPSSTNLSGDSNTTTTTNLAVNNNSILSFNFEDIEPLPSDDIIVGSDEKEEDGDYQQDSPPSSPILENDDNGDYVAATTQLGKVTCLNVDAFLNFVRLFKNTYNIGSSQNDHLEKENNDYTNRQSIVNTVLRDTSIYMPIYRQWRETVDEAPIAFENLNALLHCFVMTVTNNNFVVPAQHDQCLAEFLNNDLVFVKLESNLNEIVTILKTFFKFDKKYFENI